jgi:hypothetical protein
MQSEMLRLQQQCDESRAACDAATAQLGDVQSSVASLAEAVGLGECDGMSIDDTFESIFCTTRSACCDLVTSRALAVVANSSHRSLSNRLRCQTPPKS